MSFAKRAVIALEASCWPREGRLPASCSFAWTDLTETADVAAVRKAMYELGSAKFLAVAKAMPKP